MIEVPALFLLGTKHLSPLTTAMPSRKSGYGSAKASSVDP